MTAIPKQSYANMTLSIAEVCTQFLASGAVKRLFPGRLFRCYCCWTLCAVVVVESASGALVVKEDAMLAIPVLIIAALFLGWLLVRLTLNALALFAGVFAASVAHNAGAGLFASIGIGALCAIGVEAFGRNAGAYVHAPMTRLVIGLAFAIPAGVTAYDAMRGISGLVTGSGWGQVVSLIVAVLIAVTAGQRVTLRSDRT